MDGRLWMAMAAAVLVMMVAPARAEDSPQIGDFMAFCEMRSPECIALVARDLGPLKDTYCGPKPFDAMADARRVYAVVKETSSTHPSTTLHDAEVEALGQLWRCGKP